MLLYYVIHLFFFLSLSISHHIIDSFKPLGNMQLHTFDTPHIIILMKILTVTR